VATCRDIIKKALRRIGVVAAGREPSAAMAEEALGHLIDQYKDWVAKGVFGKFRDVRITAATYTPREQERVIIADENSCAITFPQVVTEEWGDYVGGFGGHDYGFVSYGATACVQRIETRTPRDQSVILITTECDCETRIRVYEASSARWQRIDTLELADAAPMSVLHEKLLADVLAGNLAEGYGQAIPPKLASDLMGHNVTLSHKFSRTRSRGVVEYM
jgi:hypothetical protein